MSIDIAPAITRWVVDHTNPIVADLSLFARELTHHEAVLRRRQADVTSYLERVRDLIQHAHDELEQGRVPHGDCQQIRDTGELLLSRIGNDVSDQDLQRLQDLLSGAYRVEMVIASLGDQSSRQINLAELDRTRGSFAALVDGIRVSPTACPN